MNLRQKAKKYKKEYEKLHDLQNVRLQVPIFKRENHKISSLRVVRYVEYHELNYNEHIKEIMINDIARLIYDKIKFSQQVEMQNGTVKISADIKILESEDSND